MSDTWQRRLGVPSSSYHITRAALMWSLFLLFVDMNTSANTGHTSPLLNKKVISLISPKIRLLQGLSRVGMYYILHPEGLGENWVLKEQYEHAASRSLKLNTLCSSRGRQLAKGSIAAVFYQ